MEKRTFNILCTILFASMAILGTYKLTKKKNHQQAARLSTELRTAR